MRSIKKSLICMFTCMLLSVFLLPLTGSFNAYAESELSSVTVTKGTYKGFEQLKGYPEEKRYAVYFKAVTDEYGMDSYQLSVVDLKFNPNKIIKWKYKGRNYQTKLKDCYVFFSDSTYLQSKLKVSNDFISQDWLSATFGKAYEDWFDFEAFTSDANTLVNNYLYSDTLVDRYDMGVAVVEETWLKNSSLPDMMFIFVESTDSSVSSAFRFYSSLAGTPGRVIYEVPDFKPNFTGIKTFSKIRMQYINGELNFSYNDLQTVGILR